MQETFWKPGSARLAGVSSQDYTNLSRLGTFSLRPSKPSLTGVCSPGLLQIQCLILSGKLNTGWQPGINLDAWLGVGHGVAGMEPGCGWNSSSSLFAMAVWASPGEMWAPAHPREGNNDRQELQFPPNPSCWTNEFIELLTGLWMRWCLQEGWYHPAAPGSCTLYTHSTSWDQSCAGQSAGTRISGEV